MTATTMTTKALAALALLAAVPSAQAHMFLSYPPALKSKTNPFSANPDYSMTTPLASDGRNYPCKGYHALLGTAEGKPVASWTAGQTYNMTISGGATHGGGSCQASISHDGGKSFKVIHSYVGGCPSGDGASYDFHVPSDTPASDAALFAWTWVNVLAGQPEFYMNCAVVKIEGGGGRGGGENVAFGQRPEVFKTNLGGTCRSVPSKVLKYPNPGPDVDVNGDGGAAVLPTGDCGSGGGGDSFPSGSGSVSESGSSSGGGGGGGGGTSDIENGEGGFAPNADGQWHYTAVTPDRPESTRNDWSFTPGNDWPATGLGHLQIPDVHMAAVILAVAFAFFMA